MLPVFFIINRNPKQIRAAWSEEDQKWYFSVVDVIEALTGTDRPRKYRNDLKTKLHKEGSQLSEKIGPEY
jgi:DNA-damage-inducible protein D